MENHQKDKKKEKHQIVTHLQVLNSLASMGELIPNSLDTTEVNTNKRRQEEINN